MVNRSDPLSLRQWAPLRVRNGDNRHIGKLVVNRRQVGQVEPAVQGGQMRKRSATRQREVKIVDMEMNDVELVEALKDLLQQDDMMGKGVHCLSQSQRSRGDWNQVRGCLGIAAGEKCNLFSQPHELFRQIRDNALRSAVTVWRDAFIERSYLSYFHNCKMTSIFPFNCWTFAATWSPERVNRKSTEPWPTLKPWTSTSLTFSGNIGRTIRSFDSNPSPSSP